MNAVEVGQEDRWVLGKQRGFELPEEFEMFLYADDSLAGSVKKMTFDSQGRVVVAGRGYIRVLRDTSGAGRADEAEVISEFPEFGARGLFFEGEDLLVSAEDGVYRLPGDGKGGVVEEERERVLRHAVAGTGHTGNSVRRGPDGWYYLVAGDHAGIRGRQHATLPGSPVKWPRRGAVVRFRPDREGSQVVADGFHNPYDFAFSPEGRMLVWDQTDRTPHLPWYVPGRVFDVAQGLSHGWLYTRIAMSWWNPPTYFFDYAAPIAETGDSTPTGVEVYRHRGFPERYRGGLFLADWSSGRILFYPRGELGRREEGDGFRGGVDGLGGHRYEGTGLEVFLDGARSGFSVTALEVGPDGALYASTGGWGTRGAVYRIEYTGEVGDRVVSDEPIRKVLAAKQPLSGWSRARWEPLAAELGREAFEAAARDRALPVSERIRTVEILVDRFDGISTALTRELAADGEPRVSARAVWALSRSAREGPRVWAVLSEMTSHEDPRIARAAWEAIGERAESEVIPEVSPDWLRGFDHADLRVRQAAMHAARGAGAASFREALNGEEIETPRQWVGYLFGHWPEWKETDGGREQWLRKAGDLFAEAEDPGIRLDAVRLIQIGLGDVAPPPGLPGFLAGDPDGVPPELRRELATTLAAAFPSRNDPLDREIARVMGMLEVVPDGYPERLASRWTDGSPVERDIHYLLAALTLPESVQKSLRSEIARAMVGLHLKLNDYGEEPTRSWPRHVSTMLGRLLADDPGLAGAMVEHPDFGLPGHAILAEAMEGDDAVGAARALLAAARENRGSEEGELRRWVTPTLIQVARVLPREESRPFFREHLADPRLRRAIIPLVARDPDPEDREDFLKALGSPRPDLVEAATNGLRSLGESAAPEEIARALQAFQRWANDPDAKERREALGGLIAHWVGDAVTVDDIETGYAAWFEWFRANSPETARRYLPELPETDLDFEATLGKVTWETGDAAIGAGIFAERGCLDCHSGAGRAGPSLNNVTGRFDPEELMRRIHEPDRYRERDYRAVILETRGGDSYRGRVIYSSEAVRVLTTDEGETIHFKAEEVAEVTRLRDLKMPSGLLRGLGADELAALYAYLEMMGAK